MINGMIFESESDFNRFAKFINEREDIARKQRYIQRSDLNEKINSHYYSMRYGDNGPRIPGIKKVIFNDPATIVYWMDGTKTVVKSQDEEFDAEKGLAMAISKKALGNAGFYYNTFKDWLPEENTDSMVDIQSLNSALDALSTSIRGAFKV